MELVLLRHGEAERNAASDSLRRLTAHGEAEAAASGAELAKWLRSPPVVVSSPYLRARMTADIVATELAAGAVREIPGITPDDNVRQAVLAIAGHCVPGTTLVVVTHMPLIGNLLSLLVDGNLRHAAGVRTAGGALLEGEFVAPGLMRVRRALL